MTNRLFKSLAVVLALGIAVIASTQSAYAGKKTRNFILGTIAGVAGIAALSSISRANRYDRGDRYYNRRNRYYNSGYRYRRNNYYNDRYSYRRPHYKPYKRSYYRPKHRNYYAPRRVSYRGRPAAWSPAWYRYCASKYRTFRRSDGTFQPYRGGRRLC